MYKLSLLLTFCSLLVSVFIDYSHAAVNSPFQPHRIAMLTQETYRGIHRVGEPEHLYQTLGMRTLALYAKMHGYDFVTLPYMPKFSTTFAQGTSLNSSPGWVKVFWTRKQFGSVTPDSKRAPPGTDLKAVCKKYDWIAWFDADIFITNYTVSLEGIIEESKKHTFDKNYPHFVATANGYFDSNGQTFNTGTAFIRCSDEGLQLMNYILELRENDPRYPYVGSWDMQGALIAARMKNPWARSVITLIPPKLMNSSPFHQRGPSGAFVPCPRDLCGQGWWTPGDFLVHFPGAVKEYAQAFLNAHPPHTWVGWSEHQDP